MLRTSFCRCLVLAVLLATASASAQTVFRREVPAGTAMPTGAAFSIKFPVPFTDVELKAEDAPNPTITVRSVTGMTNDRIRFTASEMPRLAGVQPQPIENFMNSLRQKPGVAELLDVQHGQRGNLQTLSFTLIDTAGGGNFFDVLRGDNAEYILLIQFHPGQRDEAAAMKDAFFNSFTITTQ